jgi:CheY-like chemotaxis protein
MPAHILVADDDPSVRRLIELVLRKGGYRLTLVTNGVRALAEIEAGPPNLVVCDLNMPEMDGFQLLTALKANPRLAHIPVIVVTAAGQQADLEEALRLGAAQCVYKPFAQAQFLETVRAILAAAP